MKKNHIVQVLGFFTILSVFVLAGCATQSSTSSASAEAVVIAPAADTSVPTMPAAAVVAAEPETELAEPTKLAPVPQVGSVASVLQKMETSPYTLYWSGKNTYTYYVGGAFDAEYEPGVGLVVKDGVEGETALTCQYDGAGSLNDATKKDACAKLMFTLDAELGD